MPPAPVLRTLGPYRVGELLIRGVDRVRYGGIDTADDSAVLVTVVDPAPRSPQAARALVAQLAYCEQLIAPLALARRADALVVVDAVDEGAQSEPRPADGPVPRQSYRRAVLDLALAVETLHAHGVAHGAIDPWSIRLDARGHLRLRAAAAGIDLNAQTEQVDLDAVTELLLGLAPDDADERLVQLVRALPGSNGGLRDLIEAAGGMLGAAAPPAPTPRRPPPERHLRHSGQLAEVAPRSARRPGPRHAAPSAPANRRLIAGAVLLVLAAAVAAVVAWPRPTDQRPEQAAQPATAQELADAQASAMWHERLTLLYQMRANAFSTAEPALLAEVYTPGSRQLYADAETIESLRAQQRQVIGFAPRLLQIESVEVSGSSASVVVLDEIDEFSIVDATGTAMPVAGRAAARTTFVLRETEHGWLIEQAHRTGQ